MVPTKDNLMYVCSVRNPSNSCHLFSLTKMEKNVENVEKNNDGNEESQETSDEITAVSKL